MDDQRSFTIKRNSVKRIPEVPGGNCNWDKEFGTARPKSIDRSTSLRLFQERLTVKTKWGKLLNLQSLVSNHRIIWWDLFFHGFERSIDTTCNRTKKILVGRSYVKGISQRRTVSTVNRLNRGKFKYLKRKETWK